MSKLKLNKINESGAAAIVASSGFWFHPVKSQNVSIINNNFEFLYIGTYPLQRRVYVWKEGIYNCILFSTYNSDNISNLIVVAGSEIKTDQIIPPETLIKNLEWKFVKKDAYPKTYYETNSLISYEANKIKLNGGLINSGFPEGWQLDISSKNLSLMSIKNQLIKKD